MRCIRAGMASLLAGLLLAAGPARGEVQSGKGQYRDGSQVTFPTPFSAVPVVIPFAQFGGGTPLVASVSEATATSFTLRIANLQGQPKQQPISVLWVAATAEPGLRIGRGTYGDGQRVALPEALPGCAIVLTAHKAGVPCLVGCESPAANGFTVRVTDGAGNPAQGVSVAWVAVTPKDWWRCGTAQCTYGGRLTFDALPTASALVASSQGASPMIVGAMSASATGSVMVVRNQSVRRASNVTTHYWAVPLTPASTTGTTTQIETLPPAGSAVQAGAGAYRNNDRIVFSPPFNDVPTVLASGQRNGEPVQVSWASPTKTEVRLIIRNSNGAALTAPVEVHWVAVGDQEGLLHGRVLTKDGQRIAFPKSLPGCTVVTTGMYGGMPCPTFAANVSAAGFDVRSTGHNGQPASQVWVAWVAAQPRPAWRSGTVQGGDGQSFAFPAMPSLPVVVTSGGAAQPALTAAKARSQAGGTLAVALPAGQTAQTSYWAIPATAQPPATAGTTTTNPNEPPPAGSAVQAGIGSHADGGQVSFGTAFGEVPGVVACGSRDGKALLVAATGITRTGFKLAIRDLAGNRVTQPARVHWAAATRQEGLQVGQATCNDGQAIAFPAAMTGSDCTVLANAARGDEPLMAGTLNVSSTGFQMVIRDHENHPANGASVQWIAVQPRSPWRCNKATCNDGNPIAFPMVSVPAAVITSAFSAWPVASAPTAMANDRGHASISLRDYRDQSAQRATVQFWVLPGAVETPEGATAGTTDTTQPPPTGPTTTAAAGPKIQTGLGGCTDQAAVTFRKAFDTVPYVFATGHRSQEPVLAKATGVTATGFVVAVRDLEGHPVTTTAMVQWVAVVPQPGLLLGQATCQNNQRVSFPANTPNATVLVSAARYGIPYLASATNITATGFNVLLRDADGNAGTGVAVQWVAVTPQADWRCGKATLSDGATLSIPPFASYPCLMTSAAAASKPDATAATNITVAGSRLSIRDHANAAVTNATVLYWAVPTAIQPSEVTGGTTEPDTTEPPIVQPPHVTLTLSDGGRTVESNCSIFVDTLGLAGKPEYDPDGDGLYQRFEDELMRSVNPTFVLDEEEDWFKHSNHHVVNFCRVTPWYPARDPQHTSHPTRILVYYGVTWTRDYGRFANDKPKPVRDAIQFLTKEHNGDVEAVVQVWWVADGAGTRFTLQHVFTSAHGSETDHSGTWSARGKTRVKGQTLIKTLIGADKHRDDWMEGELEFTPLGILRLYVSEDKHAIYPSISVGEGVTLVEFSRLGINIAGEDLGGGGEWRFDCFNAGEPEPGRRLIDDLDAPSTWQIDPPALRERLRGKFPGEQVWSGNKALLRQGKTDKKFCGGMGIGDWGNSPNAIGNRLEGNHATLADVLK